LGTVSSGFRSAALISEAVSEPFRDREEDVGETIVGRPSVVGV
jgi:hypothetical protein